MNKYVQDTKRVLKICNILSRNINWYTYPRSGRTSGFQWWLLATPSSTALDIWARDVSSSIFVVVCSSRRQ